MEAAGVHAVPDQPIADVGAHRQPGLFVEVAHEPVFDHLAGHRCVAADPVVVDPAGGHGRTERHATSRPHRHRHQPHQVEQHRELFVGLFGAVERLHRHQPAQRLARGHQPFQKGGLRLGVGVEEHQDVACAGADAMVQGPGFAAPTFGQRRRLHHPHTGALGNGCRAITGVIVDHDHLKALEALGAQGGQQVGKRALLVAGGDQHGNLQVPLQPALGEPREPQAEGPAQQPTHHKRDRHQVQRSAPAVSLQARYEAPW